MMFIDFEKAFDSIKLNCILKALKNSKINETYIQLIKYIYNYAKASIKINQYAETISLRKGIRQGDALSSKLFNAALQGSEKELEKTLECVDKKLRRRYKMKISKSETKVQVVSRGEHKTLDVRVGGEEIKEVEEFKYLGSLITRDGRSQKEIRSRIEQAKR
ncbi:hypothetical protein PGB90_005616 [Kerria lacca]